MVGGAGGGGGGDGGGAAHVPPGGIGWIVLGGHFHFFISEITFLFLGVN